MVACQYSQTAHPQLNMSPNMFTAFFLSLLVAHVAAVVVVNIPQPPRIATNGEIGVDISTPRDAGHAVRLLGAQEAMFGNADHTSIASWDAFFSKPSVIMVHRYDKRVGSDEMAHACVMVVDIDVEVVAWPDVNASRYETRVTVFDPWRDGWQDHFETFVRREFPTVYYNDVRTRAITSVAPPTKERQGQGLVIGFVAALRANPTADPENVWEVFVKTVEDRPAVVAEYGVWAQHAAKTRARGWGESTASALKAMAGVAILGLAVSAL